ncbi:MULTISPECIES: fimbria/pilus periplasmic chaperone [Pseudocitrobacter]|uniref:Fimbrial chaperone n=1 Tax=Pseudocitrobacter vendiensis TaxID=2488306 RepID=A0ABM9F7Q0_9ENTR|nr:MULTISPECIES: fimbria/pilus periplasmic chaperone [Pseudocitrobacter]KAA1050805.1 fimbrial chaperone [Pseudocitrobacter sp. 73]CAH6636821.1 Fimbrial chaperone [Pseudocitrobacter vendiensis]
MTSMRVFHRNLLWLLAISVIGIATAHASVTMLGSRIIYNAKASSVDVQLKNNDTYPYVVQTWFDEGNVDANPQNSHAVPFLSTPPVFRIQAKAGQIVRIVYNGAKPLPKDRESVFWFNFLQVPPSNVAGDQKQNKMLIMLRTRVKLFYRPEGLSAPGDITKSLQVSAVRDGHKGVGIQVKNTSSWFASLSNMTVEAGGSKIPVNVDMVSPFSSETFWLNGKSAPLPGRGNVILTAINDQGARISEHYDVTYP